jgi:hypothetical protein
MRYDNKALLQSEKKDSAIIILWTVCLLAGLLLGSLTANAQQVNEAWSFTPQNRASIAALMQQVEGRKAANAGTAQSAGITNLICGSDGKSSATGNSTCVIMSNADGNINVGQDSNGDQDANNTASDLGEVLSSLSGEE